MPDWFQGYSLPPVVALVSPGPGPGAVRGQAAHKNSPGSQSAENMQNMKKLMEQEMKSDKYKTNNNKGYVFTLMPLYAIGVGVFAAYKFLKVSQQWRAGREKKKVFAHCT